MKYMSIAIFTFFVGIAAVFVPTFLSTVQLSADRLSVRSIAPPPVRDDTRKFFDSFAPEETFSGWLIPYGFGADRAAWAILLTRNGRDTPSNPYGWHAVVTRWKGGSEPKSGDEFHAVSLTTNGDQIAFKTNKVRGIQYKFSGEFLWPGHSFEAYENVLRGTMSMGGKGEYGMLVGNFAYIEPRGNR